MKIQDIAYRSVSEFDERWLEHTRSRRGTIEVREDTPAIEVAQQVDDIGARLILVTDVSHAVVGLIAPHDFQRRLSNEFGSLVSSFVAAIHAVDLNLPTGDPSTFRDLGRPELYWCAVGAHYTDELPCPEHGAHHTDEVSPSEYRG
jgi:hypothetical protein